jgi:type I restriction enzyme S subunit
MADWREVTVAELASPDRYALATGPFGSAISSKYFVEDGVPVLRGSNLSLDVGVRLGDEGLAFLTPEKADTFQRSKVHCGDLVFTCWGTIGQVGLVDGRARFDEYVLSNKQMKLTPDSEKADSLFLYYLLSSPAVVDEVRSQSIGAAVGRPTTGAVLGSYQSWADVIGGILKVAGIPGFLNNKNALDNRDERRVLFGRLRKQFGDELFTETEAVDAGIVTSAKTDLAPLKDTVTDGLRLEQDRTSTKRGWRVVAA